MSFFHFLQTPTFMFQTRILTLWCTWLFWLIFTSTFNLELLFPKFRYFDYLQHILHFLAVISFLLVQSLRSFWFIFPWIRINILLWQISAIKWFYSLSLCLDSNSSTIWVWTGISVHELLVLLTNITIGWSLGDNNFINILALLNNLLLILGGRWLQLIAYLRYLPPNGLLFSLFVLLRMQVCFFIGVLIDNR